MCSQIVRVPQLASETRGGGGRDRPQSLDSLLPRDSETLAHSAQQALPQLLLLAKTGPATTWVHAGGCWHAGQLLLWVLPSLSLGQKHGVYGSRLWYPQVLRPWLSQHQ